MSPVDRPGQAAARAKAAVEEIERERQEADALVRDPRIQLLMRYLFDFESLDDPEFERARFGETKCAVVLRRLDALSAADSLKHVSGNAEDFHLEDRKSTRLNSSH